MQKRNLIQNIYFTLSNLTFVYLFNFGMIFIIFLIIFILFFSFQSFLIAICFIIFLIGMSNTISIAYPIAPIYLMIFLSKFITKFSRYG